MNKLVLFFSALILCFSSVSFGQADIKLSKDEFLKRLIDGQVSMKKDPLFAVSDAAKVKVMENFHKSYPTFKDAYWFVPNLRTNNYLYTVFFEWPTRRCLFRVEELDRTTRDVKRESIDGKGQSVDLKYCEKAYGIPIN